MVTPTGTPAVEPSKPLAASVNDTLGAGIVEAFTGQPAAASSSRELGPTARAVAALAPPALASVSSSAGAPAAIPAPSGSTDSSSSPKVTPIIALPLGVSVSLGLVPEEERVRTSELANQGGGLGAIAAAAAAAAAATAAPVSASSANPSSFSVDGLDLPPGFRPPAAAPASSRRSGAFAGVSAGSVSSVSASAAALAPEKRTFVKVEPLEFTKKDFNGLAVRIAQLFWKTPLTTKDELGLTVLSWFLIVTIFIDFVLYGFHSWGNSQELHTFLEAKEAWKNSGLTKTEFQKVLEELKGLAEEVVVAAKGAAGKQLRSYELGQLQAKIIALKAAIPDTYDPIQLIEIHEAIKAIIENQCGQLSIELVHGTKWLPIKYPMVQYVLKGLNQQLLRENKGLIADQDSHEGRKEEIDQFIDKYSSQFEGVFPSAYMRKRAENMLQTIRKKHLLLCAESQGHRPPKAEIDQDVNRVFALLTEKEKEQVIGSLKLKNVEGVVESIIVDVTEGLKKIQRILERLRGRLDDGDFLDSIKNLGQEVLEVLEEVAGISDQAFLSPFMRAIVGLLERKALKDAATEAYQRDGMNGVKALDEAARKAYLLDQGVSSLLPGLDRVLQERKRLQQDPKKMETSLTGIEREVGALLKQAAHYIGAFLHQPQGATVASPNHLEMVACAQKVNEFVRDLAQLKQALESNDTELQRVLGRSEEHPGLREVAIMEGRVNKLRALTRNADEVLDGMADGLIPPPKPLRVVAAVDASAGSIAAPLPAATTVLDAPAASIAAPLPAVTTVVGAPTASIAAPLPAATTVVGAPAASSVAPSPAAMETVPTGQPATA
jgi:hypothetical protein